MSKRQMFVQGTLSPHLLKLEPFWKALNAAKYQRLLRVIKTDRKKLTRHRLQVALGLKEGRYV